MNPKVSILVPIFNVSWYIERCANSIFKQTFTNIEYIFVNDGTEDDSIDKLLSVIELYPKRKERVKIIHHSNNRGVAVARNTAINSATGDYVLFVDSDDYIESNMVESLYYSAINECADIVVSDIIMEFQHKTDVVSDFIGRTKEENLTLMIQQYKTYSCLWNKLVIRNLYQRDDCKVPEGLNYAEDSHIMIRMYFFADKITKVDQAFYHYVQYNVNSITKTKKRMHFENVLQFWNLLDTFLKDINKFENFKNITEKSKIENKIRLMIDTHSSELRKEYYDMFRDIEMKYLSHFRKGEVLMLLLVRYKLFWLAQQFHNILVLKNKKLANR